MDYSWDVTENSEEDIDEEISSTASLEEDTDGRKDNGEEDFADIANMYVSSHFSRPICSCVRVQTLR